MKGEKEGVFPFETLFFFLSLEKRKTLRFWEDILGGYTLFSFQGKVSGRTYFWNFWDFGGKRSPEIGLGPGGIIFGGRGIFKIS